MSESSEHVVVIGAGIVGVSTALWLQRTGYDVTLVDRVGVAAGTSYGNAGILAAAAVIPITVPGLIWQAPGMLFNKNKPLFLRWSYFPKLLPFLIRYLSNANLTDMRRISAKLADLMLDTADQHAALAKGTPAEKYLKPGEYIFGYDSMEYFEKDKQAWDIRRELGVKFEELDAAAIAEYEPALAGKFEIAIKSLNHGHITDPGEYTKALASHFVDQGGKIRLEEITDIPVVDGKAMGITTSIGLLKADHVVITAGAWSGPLAQKFGANIPLESERGYHIEFVNANKTLPAPVMVASSKFAMTSMEGRLRCAGIVEFGGLKNGPSKEPIELLKGKVMEIFPDLEYDRIDEWMGHRPSTPDSLPLIGAFESVPNVWAGFGHQHLGLTGGPKTGRWLSQLISGEKPNVDLKPYAPDRFGKG